MTIALVQTAQGHAPAATSLTVTLSAVTAGNCLVACIGGHNINAVTGVALGTGAGSPDNWELGVSADVGAITAETWLDPGCAGGATAVTISTTVNGQINAQVFEFSGVASSPLDVSASAFSLTPGSSWSSGPTGTAAAGDVWVGMCSGDAGSAYTLGGPASPWTNEAVLNNSSAGIFSRFVAGFQVSAGSGAVTYAGTATTGQAWAAIAVALQAAGGGGGTGSATGSFLPFFR